MQDHMKILHLEKNIVVVELGEVKKKLVSQMATFKGDTLQSVDLKA